MSYGNDVPKYIWQKKNQKVCEMGYSQAAHLDTPPQYWLAYKCPPMGPSTRGKLEADPLHWKWICLAAHGRHHDSQRRMGILLYYHSEETPNNQELVQAYKWFKLAMINDGKGSLTVISKKMTSDQIADAEHLVAEWEPNPAECETIAAQAEN